MIRKILIGLVVLVIVFFAVGFLLPSKAHVERSISIASPPATIFALTDGFRLFDKWSPWLKKDPDAKTEITGPAMGVGAKYSWDGNKDVGQGTQEIVESKPYSEVKTQLFFGGFEEPSYATMSFVPDGANTKVTWSLDSDLGKNPARHYFGLFLDKLIGPDYEDGLAKLKTLAESMPKTDFSGLKVETVETPPTPIAYISGTTSTDPAVIGPALGAAYGKIGAFMKPLGLQMTGAPLAVTRRYDDEAKVYEFDAAIPIDKAPAPAPEGGEVKIGKLYSGLALKVTHVGPYTMLPKTYDLIAAYKQAYGLKDNGNYWEQYIDDPGTVPAEQLKTLVFVPYR